MTDLYPSVGSTLPLQVKRDDLVEMKFVKERNNINTVGTAALNPSLFTAIVTHGPRRAWATTRYRRSTQPLTIPLAGCLSPQTLLSPLLYTNSSKEWVTL